MANADAAQQINKEVLKPLPEIGEINKTVTRKFLGLVYSGVDLGDDFPD
jgi:hypothetical protein